jgi:hypothetical protein
LLLRVPVGRSGIRNGIPQKEREKKKDSFVDRVLLFGNLDSSEPAAVVFRLFAFLRSIWHVITRQHETFPTVLLLLLLLVVVPPRTAQPFSVFCFGRRACSS